MSVYREHDIEKATTPPLVHDTTHPDHTDDDDGAEGALVALDGAPVDGGVPTYDSGTGKHTSQVPGGGACLPLTTVVGGVPELVWDANDSLIPTFF